VFRAFAVPAFGFWAGLDCDKQWPLGGQDVQKKVIITVFAIR
jgi:hypothetical protein